MERPGLKRLLADVASGKIDVVVLYKIDRLTRSLADFARIVEVLDKAGASFVSVTQSFNTTTSMGRLTLNVLLSFAQFEREVTGERIRDKVAASKAKGMWMGGVVPLGYQVKERKLVIDDAEAATVRMIFERYAELGSTGELTDELRQRGIVTKQRKLRNGSLYGGSPFTRGALAHLLKNRVYIGEVTHRDQVYAGEHPGIVDRALWEKVQVSIANNRHERRTSSRAAEPSLLIGMVTDGLGRPMSPSHACRGTLRYRYYVSRAEPSDPHRLWRVPAHAIEQLVIERLSRTIGEGRVLTERFAPLSGETAELVRHRCTELAKKIPITASRATAPILTKLCLQVEVHDDRLEVQLDPQALTELVLDADAEWLAVELLDASPIRLTVPVQMKRRGQELRLVFTSRDHSAPARRDEKLIELVVKAHRARDILIEEQAGVNPCERPHLTRLARLSYLAPDIVTAILEGRQPANLCARQMLRGIALPQCWTAQRAMLGFT
jgi:DNA invertase Pin-like site-specific DNA recombinase